MMGDQWDAHTRNDVCEFINACRLSRRASAAGDDNTVFMDADITRTGPAVNVRGPDASDGGTNHVPCLSPPREEAGLLNQQPQADGWFVCLLLAVLGRIDSLVILRP